ncbi:MAG TPA: aspartate 1-decarboxylase [Egibacteraceae bacterium]|nr:aspartate 1-decarboxylase [Egibacteraceae bacterium]
METYVIRGERGSGDVCLNGAAARLVQPGDKVIVVAYAVFDDAEARAHVPTIVYCDERNRPLPAPLEQPRTTLEDVLSDEKALLGTGMDGAGWTTFPT